MSTLKVNTIRHTGASSDAVTLASDGTCTAKITNNLSNRNLIINGSQLVWQRATSLAGSTNIGNFTYIVDRFWYYSPSSTSGTVGQSTDVPSGSGFVYSTYNNLDADCTLGTNVELLKTGADAPFVNGESLTLSFYIKSTSARNNVAIGINTRDASTGAGSVDRATGVTFNSTTNWTRVEKTFTLSGTVGGSNKMLQFELVLAAGDKVTGFQLEKNDHATDFEYRSYGDELARCQRYYQVVRAASITAASTSSCRFNCPLPVEMRAEPSVGKAGSGNIQVGDMVSVGSNTANTPITDGYSGDRYMMSCQVDGFSGLTQYRQYCHEPALSMLGFISCSAEL